MIKKIFQVSDIHIPNVQTEKPYNDMLKRFCAELYQEIKKHNKDEVRIVLCGDIFHLKIKASNEASAMFHNMLNYLNEMCKVIIIAGNHDMIESNKDRMDSITPTFGINGAYPNVTFLDMSLGYKSGYMVDDNVIWALYSMFDGFTTPNIEGLKEQYTDSTIVGLFHGDIPGAVTDTGRMSEDGIDVKQFKDCDCVMAGHIHKYQTVKKNGIPIVYAGSLFQQHSDENISGHGFVEWNVPTLKYKFHEVTNNYRTYKFKISSYEDVSEDIEKLINL